MKVICDQPRELVRAAAAYEGEAGHLESPRDEGAVTRNRVGIGATPIHQAREMASRARLGRLRSSKLLADDLADPLLVDGDDDACLAHSHTTQDLRI